jgi:ATP adenylyltransferase
VSNERLWAPWRLEYVTGGASAEPEPLPEPAAWLDGADRECFLCRAAAEFGESSAVDRRLLVAGRAPQTLVVLNRFPYNNGHLLVAPQRHVGQLGQLSPGEHAECMQWLVRLTDILSARSTLERRPQLHDRYRRDAGHSPVARRTMGVAHRGARKLIESSAGS